MCAGYSGRAENYKSWGNDSCEGQTLHHHFDFKFEPTAVTTLRFKTPAKRVIAITSFFKPRARRAQTYRIAHHTKQYKSNYHIQIR